MKTFLTTVHTVHRVLGKHILIKICTYGLETHT